MTDLTELGFAKGEIVEIIVTTYDSNGQPNAAPMGAIMLNQHQLVIKLFISSATFKNIQSTKSAVINVTSNVDIYYKAALKKNAQNQNLPKEWFEKAKTVNAPKLSLADATIEISPIDMQPIDADRSQAVCNVKQINAIESPPKAFSRALAATIEAILHATRLKVFINKKNDEEKVRALITLISNCNDVVNRTAPNSRYSEIMVDLNENIESWRKKNSKPALKLPIDSI